MGWAARMNMPTMIGLVTVVSAGAAVWGTLFAAWAARDSGCRPSSHVMVSLCRAAVQRDRQVAFTGCEGAPDALARRTCRQQAAVRGSGDLRNCACRPDPRQAEAGGVGPVRAEVDREAFVTRVDNPYWPLRPGTMFIDDGRTARGLEHEEFAVTRNTRVILGVGCTEVRDTVRVGGVTMEDTLGWFAQDKAGNVWLFGEAVRRRVDGAVVSTKAAWMAGVDGAEPDLIIAADPARGDAASPRGGRPRAST
jgi:hypothetical protein